MTINEIVIPVNSDLKNQVLQVFENNTLGVIVDQHLNWKSNTESTCKEITSGLGAVRRQNVYASLFVNNEIFIRPSWKSAFANDK